MLMLTKNNRRPPIQVFFAKRLWSLDIEVQHSKNVNNCAIKNSYRIRIKVRWCIESSLQKIFWKFIQHTHLQTPSHFCTLPHTPMHTRAYHTHPPNHTHIHVCTFACTCARPCTPTHTRAPLSTPEHTWAHPHTPTHTSTHPCISHTYPLMPLTW